MPVLQELGEPQDQILGHLTVAYGATGLSRPRRAQSARETGLKMAESAGRDWIIPHIFAGLARVEVSLGNLEKAVQVAETARARQTATGDPSVASFALVTSATIRLLRHETDLAADQFAEGLRFANLTENPNLTASSMEGLFAVAVQRGQFDLAARLWGTAQRLRETVSVPLMPMEETIYTPLVAKARATLGDTGFTAAVEEGRAMPLTRVVELTRSPVQA